MNRFARWTSILVLSAGCAAHARESAPSASAAPAPARLQAETADAEPVPPETARPPAEQLDQADRLYNEQLSMAVRDDRYVDRQVAAITHAIRLYEQFISRAGNDERYRDAVRRSRERIKDARETIDFLLPKEAAKP